LNEGKRYKKRLVKSHTTKLMNFQFCVINIELHSKDVLDEFLHGSRLLFIDIFNKGIKIKQGIKNFN
jgi:hypothetical protein